MIPHFPVRVDPVRPAPGLHQVGQGPSIGPGPVEVVAQDLGVLGPRFFQHRRQPQMGHPLFAPGQAVVEGLGEQGVPEPEPALGIVHHLGATHQIPQQAQDPVELPAGQAGHQGSLEGVALHRRTAQDPALVRSQALHPLPHDRADRVGHFQIFQRVVHPHPVLFDQHLLVAQRLQVVGEEERHPAAPAVEQVEQPVAESLALEARPDQGPGLDRGQRGQLEPVEVRVDLQLLHHPEEIGPLAFRRLFRAKGDQDQQRGVLIAGGQEPHQLQRG